MFTLEGFGTYGCGTPSRRAGAASPAKKKREKGEKRKRGKEEKRKKRDTSPISSPKRVKDRN
jgi:hypothetical protein